MEREIELGAPKVGQKKKAEGAASGECLIVEKLIQCL